MVALDAYAVRSCPLKTFNAWSPTIPRPPAPGGQTPLPGSLAFRERVVDRLLTGDATSVDLRNAPMPREGTTPLTPASLRSNRCGDSSSASPWPPALDDAEACLAAMAAGVDVIVGGRLPDDLAGHRRGRPPLLVRVSSGGYRPAIIRFQRILQAGDGLTYSHLDDPLAPLTCDDRSYRWRSRFDNPIQLAHYWRMLERMGQAGGPPAGGVIGLDEIDGAPVISWLPLDTSGALARYDTEFAARVGLAERAQVGATADELGLEPVAIRECEWCDWWPVCRDRLADDDLSVQVPHARLNRADVLALRVAGVRTTAELAAADPELLVSTLESLDAARVGVPDRVAAAQHRARLVLDGVELERTTTGPVPVPSAELEIDIDLETSREDRVYLWGFWVCDAATGENNYRSFAEFSHIDDDAETDLARRALTWLRERVKGRQARVYHYSDYETLRISRLAERSGDPAIVWARDWAATGFVDLFAIIKKHFFGANGLGLKMVAHAGAGFSWRDPDPSGLASMTWFEEAVDAPTPAQRAQARRRLLAYNEDDVRATAAVRAWLRTFV